jgi:hypothetical protein
MLSPVLCCVIFGGYVSSKKCVYIWGHVWKFTYRVKICSYAYICYWLLLYPLLVLLSFVEKTGFSTERTTVWYVGCDSKPRFHLPLWPLRGRFIHLWLTPTVPDTQTRCCFCSFVSTWGTNFTGFTACWSPPSQFVDLYHMRGLTCQQSPKWYLIVFSDSLETFLHTFVCVMFGGTIRMLTI